MNGEEKQQIFIRTWTNNYVIERNQGMFEATKERWKNFELSSCYTLTISIEELCDKDLRDYREGFIGIDVLCEDDEFAFVVEDGYLNNFESMNWNYYFVKGLFQEGPLITTESYKRKLELKHSENYSILSYRTYLKKLSKWTKRSDILRLNLFIGRLKGNSEVHTELSEGKLSHFTLDTNGKVVLLPINKEKIDPNKKIGIFVHGLASEVGQNFLGLYDYLANDYNILAFSYPSVTSSIDTNAIVLKTNIDKLVKYLSIKQVNVFAHSMGGLVSRAALVKKAPIKSIIMAGTPNNGALLANFLLNYFIYSIKDSILIIPKELRKALKNVNRGLAAGLRDLQYESRFIKDLNEAEWNGTNNVKNYFALAGNKYRISDKVVKVDNVGTIKDFNSKNQLQLNSFIQRWEHGEYYTEVDIKLTDAMNTAKKFLLI
ncbi:esterase/lipase family protein [Bacillus paranthracis]|uniref:esterase/lipase family protein n=1 Tax=Bacillus paranthracis TaxID=2026186 RepID=UPI0028144290|nr:alpha/beta fold hydrolase [Bacillus paranthracis]MDR0170888.1 alpha/beta fold hydrolase [Bacillus paranthracis]